MKRVLVVDDDEDIRAMLDLALSAEGYEVVTAADGAAGLDAVRDATPDVILLDLKMPGMGGEEFAERYRRGPGPRAPVVVVAAAEDTAQRAAEMGAAAYLRKPFELDALLSLVGRFAGAP